MTPHSAKRVPPSALRGFLRTLSDATPWPRRSKDCSLVVGTTAVRNREICSTPSGARNTARERSASGFPPETWPCCSARKNSGLSNDALSHCHWLIRIPTCDQNISMNLGQAVAVCLYELIRESDGSAGAKQLPLATAEELERVTALLLEALQTSGFLDRRRVSDADERIRRLVRRLRLPRARRRNLARNVAPDAVEDEPGERRKIREARRKKGRLES